MDSADLGLLARQFTTAVKVKPGDRVYISYRGSDCLPMAEACKAEIERNQATAVMDDLGSSVMSAFFAAATPADIQAYGEKFLDTMKSVQAFIGIRDNDDALLLKATSAQKAQFSTATHEAVQYRVKNTNWLIVSAPTAGFAKACGMDLPAFEKSYKAACLVDYQRMAAAVKPLHNLLLTTDRVHIKGKETDLAFSIKNIGAESCTGANNIPDGECFSAPVRDSMNGTILFGPSVYEGESFKSIKLTVQNGKIVDAQADTPERTEKLNEILDHDEGGRYFGEFAIAFNPNILHPVGDILFDEKIAGSLHFAAGQCYDEAPNGNESSVHWDMVHIQRPEYGGGEIWFDDVLIRKDGIFVVPELQALNPENLRSQAPATLRI